MKFILRFFRFLFPSKEKEVPPLVLKPLPQEKDPFEGLPSLAEINRSYKSEGDVGYGDKGTLHSYIEVYEKILKLYRRDSNMLEIGIATGDSLCMWRDYFIDGNVYGIDKIKFPVSKMMKSKALNIFYGNATEEGILLNFKDIKFDVIIDDASHRLSEQLKTYKLFKNKLNPNGIYIIEDVINIDNSRKLFLIMDEDKDIEIIDLRQKKGRKDDVLVILRDKKT